MREIKVGLLGFGTIGTGVVKLLAGNALLIEEKLGARLVLKKIADLDITTDRGVPVAAGMLTDKADEVLTDPEIAVVIELIGGYEPARTFVLRAIESGKHVVTANKALLAVHGDEIFAAAARKGGGILNGTCNYILTRMTDEGAEFSEVLKDAQAQGYAEADPTFDIEGID